jgi:uroporphyrin-3 C-methyltransferase
MTQKKQQDEKPASSDKPAEKAAAQKPEANSELKVEVKPSAKKAPASSKATNKKTSREKSKASPSIVTTLALLLAVAATALGIYDFLLARMQTAQISGLHENLALQQKHNDLLQTELSGTQQELQKQQQQRQVADAEHQALRASLDSISERLGRTSEAWHMAEVEYLLTVANDRLLLAQDADTAMAVLETADQRLQAIGDPALLPVRKAIADEFTALRALPKLDIAGLSLSLSALAEQVQQLPLRDEKRLAMTHTTPASHQISNWQQLPAAVWQDLKSLVQVRRREQPIEPLLPPQQRWFLYQNLQLKLQQARLAIMQRDSTLLRESLHEADSWLETFFVNDDPAVQSARATLAQMSSVELAPMLPDISASLRTLRQLMAQRQSLTVPPKQQPPLAKQSADNNKAVQP